MESQLKNTQVTHTYGSWREWNVEHEKLVALTRRGYSAREARAQLHPDDPSPSSKAIKGPSRPIKARPLFNAKCLTMLHMIALAGSSPARDRPVTRAAGACHRDSASHQAR